MQYIQLEKKNRSLWEDLPFAASVQVRLKIGSQKFQLPTGNGTHHNTDLSSINLHEGSKKKEERIKFLHGLIAVCCPPFGSLNPLTRLLLWPTSFNLDSSFHMSFMPSKNLRHLRVGLRWQTSINLPTRCPQCVPCDPHTCGSFPHQPSLLLPASPSVPR